MLGILAALRSAYERYAKNARFDDYHGGDLIGYLCFGSQPNRKTLLGKLKGSEKMYQKHVWHQQRTA